MNWGGHSEALPPRQGLVTNTSAYSKPSTQADLESDWAAYWISEIKLAHIFHRKLWNSRFYFRQYSRMGDYIRRTCLGFGCGAEPLPSYFASRGVDVTVTDLDPTTTAARGWIDTEQHTSLDMVFQPHLVSREQFDRHVTLRYVDMNSIPADLCDYDFCWSICALEHIGSIQKGLDFIELVADLAPGRHCHTYNRVQFSNDEQTIDDWPTVRFRSNTSALTARLEQ